MAAAFEKVAAPVPGAYGLASPAGLSAVYCQILGPGRQALTEILALPHAETAAFFEGRAEAMAGPASGPLSEAGYVSVPVRGAAIAPDAGTLAELAPGLDPGRDLPSPYYVRPPDAKPPDQAHHPPRRRLMRHPEWFRWLRLKTPSSCPSPQGEKGPLNLRRGEFWRPLAPTGRGQGEGGLRPQSNGLGLSHAL